MKKSLVRIATLDNEVEAQVLSSLLKEIQIDHMLQSNHDPAYDGIFQIQKGWGILLADEDDRGKILELLGELRRQVKCCEVDADEDYDCDNEGQSE